MNCNFFKHAVIHHAHAFRVLYNHKIHFMKHKHVLRFFSSLFTLYTLHFSASGASLTCLAFERGAAASKVTLSAAASMNRVFRRSQTVRNDVGFDDQTMLREIFVRTLIPPCSTADSHYRM